jgi:hypothetical protein
MHKKVPAEKANALAVHDDAELEPSPPIPSAKKATPAGIMRPKPKFTKRADQRDDPPRSMREVIVRASAGL